MFDANNISARSYVRHIKLLSFYQPAAWLQNYLSVQSKSQ